MNMRFTHALAGMSLVAAATLLTGCGSNPVEGAINDAVDDAMENVVEEGIERGLDEAGVEIEVGEDVSVPDSFPDIPLPDAELTSAVTVDSGAQLTYTDVTVEQAEAAAAAIEAEPGFTLNADSDLGGLRSFQFESAEYIVVLTYIYEDGIGELAVLATPAS